MPTSSPPSFPYRSSLEHPVVGLESEFTVLIDGRETDPEEVWRAPADFISIPVLKRSTKSSQLPTGGAVYFDKGVIEVVTPGIELESDCAPRVVRNLWEQIAFIRDELTRWESVHQRTVQLRAFSTHYNVSFEIPREERNANRTIQKLALLLAYLLPVPLIVIAENNRSTGIGVRPRRNRIEVTLDFTPDPGLMCAATALVLGVVRGVMSWPSYLVADLEQTGLPILEGVDPGKHTTRNGWLTRDLHFPQNPFTTPHDLEVWSTRDGRRRSLRAIARDIVTFFADSIRQYADPFTFELLLGLLSGDASTLGDFERPPEYDDVARTVRWGTVLPSLSNYELAFATDDRSLPHRRAGDPRGDVAPPWSAASHDRRHAAERAGGDRRASDPNLPLPLPRSRYEQVFINLGRCRPLQSGAHIIRPVGVKGWYHAMFEREDGARELISIDDLAQHLDSWR